MFHDDDRILGRVDRALRERIRPAVLHDLGALEVAEWAVPGDGEPVPYSALDGAEFTPVSLPRPWGRAWSTTFFRLTGTAPAVPEGTRLRVEADLGFVDDWPGNQCEGLLLDEALRPLKAINSRNRSVLVDAPAGTSLTFTLEAAANPDMLSGGTVPSERGDRLTAGPEQLFALRTARWVARDETVWALEHDLDVLRGLAAELPADSVRRARILCALDDALGVLDLRDVRGTAQRAREVLAPALAAPANASALQVTTIGHAHIDSAWLWPVRETVRKVGRTFSNVVALMDEYPDLTFTATSAQQYAWLKESQPEIYARVREKIAEGRWVPSGGMWVESDVMMPGGEALIRQFAYGTRFFEEEFGVRSRTLWLPDSFGYSAALPQIARQVGMDGFLTQKISWNRTNQHPHSTFWWEGIDGTRIFTHFPPVNCYDSMLTADEIAAAERNFAERGRATHQVIPFGYGDGGGGPTADMVERARRRTDLEGSPRLEMGDPDGFFDAAREEYSRAAPVHRGELYLEFHRGIFTSQLEMKQGNRRIEHALRTLELVWALVTARRLGTIDQAAVDALWQRALLLQFHDILPGSSIAWVHREAREDYARMLQRAEELTADGLRLLAADGGTGADGVSLLNPGPHARRQVVALDGELRLLEVPATAIIPLEEAGRPEAAPVEVARQGEEILLRNAHLEVAVGADGTLRRVLDRAAERDVLVPGGEGMHLELFEDLPNEFDAWDIDRHYRGSKRDGEVRTTSGLRVLTESPARAVLAVDLLLGGSPATLTIGLDTDSRQVDMALEVDWQERETLLKVAVPLAVQARETLAETQFGHITRPLHENTSWEFAKFEMPMHRWLLAAEPGWGAAVVNDSSYGFDAMALPTEDGRSTVGTLLRPSLMRAPNWPDPGADRSVRTVRWSLLVGADPVSAAHAANALHLPLRPVPGTVRAQQLAAVDDPGVHVDAVLPAHDGSGDFILRLHEGRGARTRARLHLGLPVGRVREVDPLDAEVPESERTLALDGVDPAEGIPLDLRPFQILSLRLTPGDPA
ncbi:alpha-mannosidase [Brachybacterium muris]|uniref:alpha-mannosidase n=1 Tax=Brachybacterium muris TaxID=219301 RepID=UPI00195876F7|nr:glycoside hydrolase family 38 C-terminal domain-containing protein [Brachybacterium muris]MBM7500295.1 alpha-mannosidase [Brachybacterium muris]